MKKYDFGGRPAKYDSPDEMAAKVAEYFKQQDEANEPYTVTGLTLHLGFCDRQSLNDYQKRDAFSALIKKARLTIEQAYEKSLTTSEKATGVIFWLKNHGWSDTQKVELTQKNLPTWFEDDES
jgi:hypothetical protein